MSVFRMLRCGDNRHGEGQAKSFYRHIVPPSHCIAAMASIASDNAGVTRPGYTMRLG